MSSGEHSRNKIQRRLAEKFRTLSVERLERLNLAVMTLEGGAPDDAVVEETLREIHTLKGEARLVGFPAISSLSHAAEDLILAIQAAQWSAASETWDLVLEGLDRIASELREEGGDADAGAVYREQVDRTVAQGVGASAASAASATAGEVADSAHEHSAENSERDADTESAPASASRSERLQQIAGSRGGSQILVDTPTLDELISLLGGLAQGHSRTRTAALRLRRKLRDAQEQLLEFRRQASSRASREIRALDELLLGAEDDLRELGNLRFDRGLRLDRMEDVFRELRMVPLSVLLAPMPRAVRDLARDLGKNVGLEIEGAEIPVDQKIHGALRDPLLHLLRNAVDHGIELDREEAGKPATAVLEILVERRGAYVSLEIRDDGAGIDDAKVVAKAVQRGLVSPEQAEQLTTKERLALVFHSGLSTRDEATEFSGRGVGLDVVRHTVESLGGSVQLSSELGSGTSIRLTLPASLAFQSLLLVGTRSGTTYGIPAASVVRVLRLGADQLKDAAGTTVFDLDHEILPLFDFSAIVGESSNGESETQTPQEEHTVVVVEHGVRRVGFELAHVLNEESLIYRNLDPFLEDHLLVAGTAVRGDGSVVLVLSVPELIQSVHLGERRRMAAAFSGSERRAERDVLVIDDSDLTRAMICEILQGYGHRTFEAANGREALDRLRSAVPDLMLVDLDMPVMSGFEFLAARRDMPAARSIPAIVFSSRGSDEDKRRCLELGADAYVVKSEFSEGSFYGLIERFLE